MPKVTEIGEGAFLNTALVSVSMPKVTDIGVGAFKYCTALTNVTMPNVETIGAFAFNDTALTSVDMPKVTTIGNGAFYGTDISAQDVNIILRLNIELNELKSVLESFKNCSCGNAMLSSCSGESIENIVNYTKQIHSC